MAITDLFKKSSPTPSFLPNKKAQAKSTVEEALKGTVNTKKDRFDKKLGIPHPFDFKTTEDLYKKNGLVAGNTDRVVEWVWGPGLTVKSPDKKAEQIIVDWMRDTDFQFHGRRWLREALVKGSGFLELANNEGGSIDEIKTLSANNMFIKMNDKGKITGFNQARETNIGSKEKPIPFKPEQIALYTHSQIGDNPYGLGLIFPNFRKLNQLLQADSDMHTILRRKANSPLVATLGNKDNPEHMPAQGTIDAFGDNMTFLNATTEFAVSDLVKFSVIDFGSVGDKFELPLMHDIQALLAGFQMPEVLSGRGNIPEGLAKVQLETFNRHIGSIQEDLEKVIEEKIFRRVLRANGIQSPVEVIWGLPGKADVEEEIKRIIELLKNPLLETGLRISLEDRLATLMNLEVKTLDNEEDRRQEEEEEAQPKVPGQNQAGEFYETEFLKKK